VSCAETKVVKATTAKAEVAAEINLRLNDIDFFTSLLILD
jgi:hypothetical protein